MKDIKDYLHLYLGCEVECSSLKFGVEHIATLDGVVNDSNSDEYPVKVSLLNDGFKYRSHYCYLFEEVKPILRPLSDMTEDEANELCEIETPEDRHHSIDVFEIQTTGIWYMDGSKWYGDGVEEYIDMYIQFSELSPKQFLYLLSKHFDLFNLLESGLAIDRTKLKSE